MKFEDHFSGLAAEYLAYRPLYPVHLYEYLSDLVKNHDLVWDCGTGNGQSALHLAKYFRKVFATDASQEQINLAPAADNVIFKAEPAESVSLMDNSADLVTVATAIHWFDHTKFYNEVNRVLKSDGFIAAWGYQLPFVSPEIDKILSYYFSEILGNYWPEKIKYLVNRYENLPFPFNELKTPKIQMKINWNLNQLKGFLVSWSASKRYFDLNGIHPVSKIEPDLNSAWGYSESTKEITWHLFMKIGKKHE